VTSHGLRTWALTATLVAGAGLSASAEGTREACWPILRAPRTISYPGHYCLVRSVSTHILTGAAITIAADDVVLDLRGHILDGSAAGPATEAVGIGAVGRSNITIRNGIVRGFLAGIQLTDQGASRGHVIEGVTADRNTSRGIESEGAGLRIEGNHVRQTGGSTSPLGARAYGLLLRAPESVVLDNEITGTSGSGSFVYGILATGSDGSTIEGNRIANRALPAFYSFGILLPFSFDVLVVNNRITRFSEGVDFSSNSTGKYRDNLTAGVPLPYAGTGIDAGNNQ
jgi:Right handed beta helix region